MVESNNSVSLSLTERHTDRQTDRQTEHSENRTLREGDHQNSFLTGLQVKNGFVTKSA